MIKRTLCFFVCLLLFVGTALPVIADQQRVFDEADLFTAQEEASLEKSISRSAEQTPLDLVVVTVLSTGSKDAQTYADDFFDDGGFGVGDDFSGALLLIDMGASEVAVSTTGYGIRLLSDARIDKILDAVVEHLAEGEAAEAAQAFLNMVTDYASQDVSQSQNGFQTEGKVPSQQKKSFLKAAVQALPISLIIGIVSVGTIYLACGRSGKSEVRPKSYRYYSSLQLSRKEDRLVDKHVSTRRLPRNNPPPGAGRSFGSPSTHSSSSGRIHGGGSRSFGGSSTRISSSGRRHGGGSRKF